MGLWEPGPRGGGSDWAAAGPGELFLLTLQGRPKAGAKEWAWRAGWGRAGKQHPFALAAPQGQAPGLFTLASPRLQTQSLAWQLPCNMC